MFDEAYKSSIYCPSSHRSDILGNYVHIPTLTHTRCNISKIKLVIVRNRSQPSHSQQHPQHVSLLVSITAGICCPLVPILGTHRARSREEQNLDRNREPSMQRHDDNEKDLARLRLSGTEHRVKVPQQEEGTRREAEGDEHKVENCKLSVSRPSCALFLPSPSGRIGRDQHRLTIDGAYARNRHGNPNQIRIPIQTQALQQIRTLAPIPLQHGPQPRRHHPRIPIHQPRGAAQQLKVVCKMRLPLARQILIYRAGEEENDDDGRRDPDGAVQIRIALQHVEEVCTRVYGGCAAAQDLVRVHVEGLRVEGQRPEEVLAGGGGRGGRGKEAARGGGVGLDLAARVGRVFEV